MICIFRRCECNGFMAHIQTCRNDEAGVSCDCDRYFMLDYSGRPTAEGEASVWWICLFAPFCSVSASVTSAVTLWSYFFFYFLFHALVSLRGSLRVFVYKPERISHLNINLSVSLQVCFTFNLLSDSFWLVCHFCATNDTEWIAKLLILTTFCRKCAKLSIVMLIWFVSGFRSEKCFMKSTCQCLPVVTCVLNWSRREF